MSAIINSQLIKNEVSKNAMGGTELMAQRMVDNIDPSKLGKYHIIHSRIRDEYLNEDPSKNILVLHDLPTDPESAKLSDPEFRKKFGRIVCVSNWQKEQYHHHLGIPYSEMIVIYNAVDERNFKGNLIKEKMNNIEEVRFIYHTTPHRGLELLYPVFDALVDRFRKDLKLHLDVYSSFDIYGWKERNAQYENLFSLIDSHENMTYHGTVSNDEVIEALHSSHIFLYPNIWLETFCLSAVEAMMAGNLVIAPHYGALTEIITRNNGILYNFSDNPTEHANLAFQLTANVLSSLINSSMSMEALMMNNDIYPVRTFNLSNYIRSWESILI